jgi:2,5-furandicarboxylate decarboxylase 1
MKQRYTGEARHAILSTIASSQPPSWSLWSILISMFPDQVEWAIVFRSQPSRDVIIVNGLPGATLHPSVNASLPLNRRVGSAIGIDATFSFGADEQKVPDVPAGEACGPAGRARPRISSKLPMCPVGRNTTFPSCRNTWPSQLQLRACY